eukprot:6463225-Amphidinium_carterae.1
MPDTELEYASFVSVHKSGKQMRFLPVASFSPRNTTNIVGCCAWQTWSSVIAGPMGQSLRALSWSKHCSTANDLSAGDSKCKTMSCSQQCYVFICKDNDIQGHGVYKWGDGLAASTCSDLLACWELCRICASVDISHALGRTRVHRPVGQEPDAWEVDLYVGCACLMHMCSTVLLKDVVSVGTQSLAWLPNRTLQVHPNLHFLPLMLAGETSLGPMGVHMRVSTSAILRTEWPKRSENNETKSSLERPDGRQYDGMWKDGKQHGSGTYRIVMRGCDAITTSGENIGVRWETLNQSSSQAGYARSLSSYIWRPFAAHPSVKLSSKGGVLQQHITQH